VLERSGAPARVRCLERSGARFFFVLKRSVAEHFFWCWSGAEQDIFFGVGAERSRNFFGTWSGAEWSVEWSGALLEADNRSVAMKIKSLS